MRDINDDPRYDPGYERRDPYAPAYTLTLTTDEISAIDWVGDRYEWASAAYDYLDDEKQALVFAEESDAWDFYERCEEDDAPFPCAAPELAQKLQRFLDTIV